MIPSEARELLVKQHYRLVGGHSAVKLCHWLKKSLLDAGVCYKQQFYGIESHRCLQMTPAVSWCTQRCLFCWRNTEHTVGSALEKADEAADIIESSIEAQRKLLTGYGGIPERVNQKKLKEAHDPNQVAISLSGEPTAYPKIQELVAGFSERKFTTFLVSNGTFPERLASLDPMPTQLYLSVDAPDKGTYERLCCPTVPDAWAKVNESLDFFPSLDTRTAVRVTLVRGENMLDPAGYAKLIGRAEPDFVEVKAYMFVGGSRQRLSLENMPSFDEVKSFAESLASELSYDLKDEKRDSRVVLLSKRG